MADVAWLGVLVAAVAGSVVNVVWFGPRTMFPLWWRAMGKPDDEIPGAGQNMPVIFGLTTLALLVQAIVMTYAVRGAALLSGGTEDVSLVLGIVTGLGLGAGIAASTSLGHRRFSGQGLVVWIIEVGGDILALIAMGAVLSGRY
jgi:hypothetical protein